MSQSTVCYRVVFTSEGKTQELFAKYICEESLMGFVEVEELLFLINLVSLSTYCSPPLVVAWMHVFIQTHLSTTP